uniref:Uncharacterized protein n=1 Tax=Panagrolaimus sp. JU765 TaxID=591449 RepID=A0AC34QK95_9BILA
MNEKSTAEIWGEYILECKDPMDDIIYAAFINSVTFIANCIIVDYMNNVTIVFKYDNTSRWGDVMTFLGKYTAKLTVDSRLIPNAFIKGLRQNLGFVLCLKKSPFNANQLFWNAKIKQIEGNGEIFLQFAEYDIEINVPVFNITFPQSGYVFQKFLTYTNWTTPHLEVQINGFNANQFSTFLFQPKNSVKKFCFKFSFTYFQSCVKLLNELIRVFPNLETLELDFQPEEESHLFCIFQKEINGVVDWSVNPKSLRDSFRDITIGALEFIEKKKKLNLKIKYHLNLFQNIVFLSDAALAKEYIHFMRRTFRDFLYLKTNDSAVNITRSFYRTFNVDTVEFDYAVNITEEQK